MQQNFQLPPEPSDAFQYFQCPVKRNQTLTPQPSNTFGTLGSKVEAWLIMTLSHPCLVLALSASYPSLILPWSVPGSLLLVFSFSGPSVILVSCLFFPCLFLVVLHPLCFFRSSDFSSTIPMWGRGQSDNLFKLSQNLETYQLFPTHTLSHLSHYKNMWLTVYRSTKTVSPKK